MENEYFVVTVDEAAKLVRVKRTTTQYPSIEVLRESNDERARKLAPLAGKGYAMLLDARDGPLRNDPAFENETIAARAKMIDHFSKVAILVRTAVGALQMNRLQRDERSKIHVPVQVFHDDEAAALKFLSE